MEKISTSNLNVMLNQSITHCILLTILFTFSFIVKVKINLYLTEQPQLKGPIKSFFSSPGCLSWWFSQDGLQPVSLLGHMIPLIFRYLDMDFLLKVSVVTIVAIKSYRTQQAFLALSLLHYTPKSHFPTIPIIKIHLLSPKCPLLSNLHL